MDEDAFETVAITWSQPEAAVMLAMFAFYGIPAFAAGRHHTSANPAVTVALQGIHIRVVQATRDEALELLAEVAERPAAVRPYLFGAPFFHRALFAFLVVLLGLSAVARDPAFALIASMPAALLLVAPPPTRTTATFMLWKRARPAATDS